MLCVLFVNLQGHSYCPTEAAYSHTHPHHVVIPWYPIKESEQGFPPDIKFHPIKKNVSYRFWNPVSNGLMQRVDKKVTCSGGFDSADSEYIL